MIVLKIGHNLTINFSWTNNTLYLFTFSIINTGHWKVSAPDETTRRDILMLHLSDMPVENDIDIAGLANICRNFTGAEIAAVCREAALSAMRQQRQFIRYGDVVSSMQEIISKPVSKHESGA